MRFDTMPSRSIQHVAEDGGPVTGDRLAQLNAVAQRLVAAG
jgi:hypothetical protein